MNPTHRKIAWTLSTWFGCGCVPIAPGTAGAIGAIPLYLASARGGRLATGAVALAVAFAGVWAASSVARELEADDPQVIVIDEVAGMLVTMLAVNQVSLKATCIGFVLFRLLDAAKPWPIRCFERFPSGWGIVLDDIAAGLAAAIILAALER